MATTPTWSGAWAPTGSSTTRPRTSSPTTRPMTWSWTRSARARSAAAGGCCGPRGCTSRRTWARCPRISPCPWSRRCWAGGGSGSRSPARPTGAGAAVPGAARVRGVPAAGRPDLSAGRDRRGLPVRRDGSEARQRGDQRPASGPVTVMTTLPRPRRGSGSRALAPLAGEPTRALLSPAGPGPRRLADLDQVAVRVTHVAADLAAVVLGRGEEHRPFGAPLLVDGLDVGHPEVQEGAGPAGVAGRLQDDVGLVVGRPATDVDDHPAVGQLDDRRLAVEHDPAAEHAGVEVAGAGHVRGDDEVGEHESLARGGEVLACQAHPPPTPPAPRPTKRGRCRVRGYLGGNEPAWARLRSTHRRRSSSSA